MQTQTHKAHKPARPNQVDPWQVDPGQVDPGSQAGQKGSALLIGIVCFVILAVVAIGVFVLLASQKPQPILTVNQPKVTADSTLTTGKSNNELVQDVLILTEGVKRDDQERQSANTILSDQPAVIGTTSSGDAASPSPASGGGAKQ